MKAINWKTILIILLSFWGLIPNSKAKDSKIPVRASQTRAIRQKLSNENKRKFEYFYLESLKEREAGNNTAAYNDILRATEIDSTSAEALYELSNYLMYLKQPQEALTALRNAVKYENSNFEYKVALANLTRDLDLKDESVQIFEDLLKENQDKPELYYYLSDLYTKKGETDKAIKALDALEQSLGINEGISLQKFRLYMSVNKKDKALQEIEKLSEKNPDEPKYIIMLGDLFLDQQNPEKAYAYYQKAHKIDPENPYYYVSMANYYDSKKDSVSAGKEIELALKNEKLDVDTKLGILTRYIQNLVQNKKDIQSANSLFETLMEQHPQETKLNYMYGQYLLAQNKNKDAKFQFKVVTESDPANEAAWKQLIGIYLKEDKPDDIITLCDQALVHFPKVPDYYLYAGSAYFEKKDYPKALEKLKEGLTYIPKEDEDLLSTFYAQIGDIYHQKGNKEKAYESYDKALNYNGNNIFALNNYAYFLSLDKKNLEKAERMSNACVKLAPDNSTYIDTYAWVFFVEGKYSLAKFYIESALSKGGDKSSDIVEHYGDILYQSGEKDKALEQWEKALELRDKSENSDILKKKIKDKKYYENDKQ